MSRKEAFLGTVAVSLGLAMATAAFAVQAESKNDKAQSAATTAKADVKQATDEGCAKQSQGAETKLNPSNEKTKPCNKQGLNALGPQPEPPDKPAAKIDKLKTKDCDKLGPQPEPPDQPAAEAAAAKAKTE